MDLFLGALATVGPIEFGRLKVNVKPRTAVRIVDTNRFTSCLDGQECGCLFFSRFSRFSCQSRRPISGKSRESTSRVLVGYGGGVSLLGDVSGGDHLRLGELGVSLKRIMPRGRKMYK